MLRIFSFLGLVTGFTYSLSAQEAVKREMQAARINSEIHIDGKVSESEWQTVAPATDFTQFQFTWDVPSAFRSEVRVLYDNTAIYIGAELFDPHPDSIQVALGKRDEFGVADFFGVILDPYQEGTNGVEFFVTAAGVQNEAKTFAGAAYFDEDFSWDAVWASAVSINPDGWSVEIKIPYSAIRFPNSADQVWGINFVREVKRNRDKSAWNRIDPEIEGFIKQAGILKGVQNIEAPVRLSLSPYFSTYYDIYSDNENNIRSNTWSLNGGADIKYGINDAFTVDMTLIPDFGQVQSDNQILNLTPFETYFVEQRQFFTEGTELFKKGDLFYSRRVGGTPFDYWSLPSMIDSGDVIIENPAQAQLLNATKLSGRTTSGLGIGVFNAIEGETYATVRDSLNNDFGILTGPATNYNVLVFDQSVPNNSFVSLINTNVMRSGEYYDADVTGIEFRLNNKTSIWGIAGGGSMSQKYFNGFSAPETGLKHKLYVGKTGGRKQFFVGYDYTDAVYDPNDLGFQSYNNTLNFEAHTSYSRFDPIWHLNQLNLSIDMNYTRLVDPSAFQNFSISGDAMGSFRNYLFADLWFNIEPVTTYDYYEPRSPWRYYTFPVNYNFGGWISSDYGKRFAIDANSNLRLFDQEGRYRLNIGISPRFRVNDKILLIADGYTNHWVNDVGWVNTMEDSIIFGIRDNFTYVLSLEGSYTPNVKMSFSLRGRHYWSFANYKSFYALAEDGSLISSTYSTLNGEGSDDDVNFNAFNIDLIYTWFFAPGSELNIVWKNSIYQFGNYTPTDYFDDINLVFDAPQSNNFSVKVLYYLDYLYLKNHTHNPR